MTMETRYDFYDNAPGDYGLCLKAECPSAGECLRQLAARDLKKDPRQVFVVNPLVSDAHAGKASCPFFRKAELVKVAYGFRHALAQIPNGEVRSVRYAILGLVCRRDYYYLLNGEKPMYPRMQQKVADILRRYGLEGEVEFDRYDWRYEW